MDLAVLAHRAARRCCDLDQADPTAQFRILLQQVLEGEQAAGDAFRVVEAVDRNDQGGAIGRLAQALGLRHDPGAASECVVRGGIDAHREGTDANGASGETDAPLVNLAAEHVSRRRLEVKPVGDRVKPNQRRPEHALQQLSPPLQKPEDLGRGKWHVQEEADRGVGKPLPHQPRDERKLIVVDPDQIARLVLVNDCVREPPVHSLVRVPAFCRERQLVQLVVEQRPQDAVRKAVVVALNLGRGQLYRNCPQRGQAFAQDLALIWCEAPGLARPADPDASASVVVAAEAGREPSGAALDDHLAVLDMNRDGQSVRDQDHPARRLRAILCAGAAT